ncbi:MAG: HAD family hydrolase [Niabella sp.]
MIKLIVTDLDGSLLTDDKQIPPDFWDIIKQLQARGIVFVLASGRPYQGMLRQFEPLKPYAYFASDNGSYLLHNEDVLLTNALLHEDVAKFASIARPIPDTVAIACGRELAYMEPCNDELKKVALQYYQRYEIVYDLSSVTDTILKISICDIKGSAENSFPHFEPFAKDYKIAVSGKVWLDITSATANKGTAIKYLQEWLGISPDETLAFGDYMNDLELLQSAKYSYAMKNAEPQVAAVANFMTEKTNNEYGVTETIKQIMQLG